MKIPHFKLKNQLAIVNAMSKAIIILLLFSIIPYLVSKLTIKETDDNLIVKLDEVFNLIDSLGIENFIDKDADFKAFGSYNILKEEYISIEQMDTAAEINNIADMQRVIENDVVDYRVLSYSFLYGDNYYLIEIGKSISTIYRFEKQLRQYAIVFMLVLLALTVLVEISVIQYMLRPLDFIVRKLKKTKHPTAFDYTTIKTRTSDFKYLEETLHSLMRKIETSFNNEREYISNVSHELLTPISIIQSKLDNIILDGKLKDAYMLKIFESKKTLGRLTKMVRTLLTMSRIENEEYLIKENVNVIDLLKNVTHELEDRIEMKQLKLIQDWKRDAIVIHGNQDLLFNLFYNLFNNAIKYTDSGYIKVVSDRIDKLPVITISDTGKGIDKEHIPYIFTRFRKFRTGQDNFGLGLALAKKICDYHKIDISVNSEIGQGTCFTLKFHPASS